MKTTYKTESLPTDALLLDSGNPRLADTQLNQNTTALALAQLQGVAQVLKLAKDIVENGLDPISLTAVVPTKKAGRYKVIEGNRRLLALRVLDAPALISPLVNDGQARRLNKLSDDFADDPITEVVSVIFGDEDEARHWITLRHTGQNEGTGLVEWDSEQIDRYQARHDGMRSPAGQVIEFVNKHGVLSDSARESDRRIITNVERVLTTPDARKALGVDVCRGRVIALAPLDELAKSLGRLVEDLKTTVGVDDIRTKDDRVAYVKGLPKSVIPAKSKRLDTPVSLSDFTEKPGVPKKPAPKTPKTPARRNTVIPKGVAFEIETPRINAVYIELTKLSANTYLNACSVLFRVFIEMSVDQYMEDKTISVLDRNGAPNESAKLAAKIDATTEFMSKNSPGLMPSSLRKAINKFANSQDNSVVGVQTFHMYVHNRYYYPSATDLYGHWDQLQPFLEALWNDNDEGE